MTNTSPRLIMMGWLGAYVVCALLLADGVAACGPGRGIGESRRRRRFPALVFKQYVPNMGENTLGGSGLEEGIITRHDAKFRDLVPNYNKDIIFKDEEGTGADRFMSQVNESAIT